MEYIKLAFSNLPVAAWAAVGTIFGAIVALAATLISNVGNNNRLKIQLEHDAKEKNIDRMNTLRKEVYLAAVGEISGATSYLSSLPSKDLSKMNISEDLQGLFIAAAKLSLVASTSTQKAIDILGVAYSNLIFLIIQRVGPLQQASNEIALNDRLYEDAMTDVRRILGELTRFNEGARTEALINQALHNSFDFFSGQAKKINEERRAAYAEFNRLTEMFNKQLFLDMAPVAALQVEVMISVRADLGIDTDDAEIRERQKKHWGQIVSSAEEALEKMKTQ
ncbi:hypothetical protein [Pseudomonas capeferrum]